MKKTAKRMVMQPKFRSKIFKSRKRYSRKKNCGIYDSGLEQKLHDTLLKGAIFHPDKIDYTSEHTYEPDFSLDVKRLTILVESKGRFRDRSEAKKYVDIRKALQENQRLVFIFQDAAKPMPAAQKRKDGTRLTHGEWATKNDFLFLNLKTEGEAEWTKLLELLPR